MNEIEQSNGFRIVLFMRVIALFIGLLVLGGCSKNPAELFASAKQREAKGDRIGAIIDVKAALQQEPNNGAMRFALGRLYNDTFDGASAEKELKKALELGLVEGGRVVVELARALRGQGKLKELLENVQPSEAFEPSLLAAVHALRGRAHFSLRELSSAREDLAKAQEIAGEVPEVMLLAATVKAHEQMHAEALAEIDKLLTTHPMNFDAWRLKAQLLYLQHKESETLHAYGKLLEIHPAYFQALTERSTLLMKLGRVGEARKDVERLLRLYKQNPESYVQMAVLLLVEGRAPDALEAIQIAQKASPYPPKALLVAGLVYQELGSLQQAENQLSQYVVQSPSDAFGRAALAALLVKANSAARAVEVLTPVLNSRAATPWMHSIAGDAFSRLGDVNRALLYYEKAALADPADPEGRIKQAMLRMKSGDLDRGIEDLEGALGLTKIATIADEILVLTRIQKGQFDEAMAAARRMEQKAPESPLTANMMGVVLLSQKDEAGARVFFEKALKLAPNFYPAARNLAHLDLVRGDRAAARSRLEGVVARDPKSTLAYLELARIASRIDATPLEVEGWLKSARVSAPDAAEPVVMLARYYLVRGDVRSSVQLLEQAIANGMKDPLVVSLAAEVQSISGEKNRSLATIGKVLVQEPQSVSHLLRLAKVQLGNNLPNEAAVTLRKALAQKPELLEPQLLLAEVEVRLGRLNEALKIAFTLKNQKGRGAEGWVLEGDIYARDKKYAHAISAYEKALSIRRSGPTIAKLAGALMLNGRAQEGEQRLKDWLKESPGDIGTNLFLAQAYRKSGNHSEAIQRYEYVLSKQPDNVVALNNVALSYQQVGDRRALIPAEQAYKLVPGNPAIVETLGSILVEFGDAGRGVELLRKAVNLAPRSPAIRLSFARGLAKSGNLAAAKEQLIRFKGDFPNSPEHGEASKLLTALEK